MSRSRFLPGGPGRSIALTLVGLASLLALTSTAVAGPGFLRKLADGAEGAARRIDADAPPLERALQLLGDGPDAGRRYAVLVAPDGRAYQVFTPDGHHRVISGDQELLTYLDESGRATDGAATPILSEDVYFRLRDRLAYTSASADALVGLWSGRIVPLRRVEGPDGPFVALEVEQNFLYDAGMSAELEDFESMLRVSFDAPDVRVVSLFDKADHRTRATLDSVAGETHIDLAGLKAEEVLDRIARLKRRIVVVVGHIEGDYFVIRDPEGAVATRVAVAELERVADEAEASLILLGCDTVRVAEHSSGLAAPVRDVAVAQALSTALREQDYGGFLSALGSDEAPFLVRAATARRHNWLMEAERLGDARDLRRLTRANVIGIAIGGRSPASVAELRSRLVPFIPVWLQYLYVSGGLAAAFIIRPLWREWIALFPLLSGRSGWRTRVLWSARAAGFLVAGPAIGMLVLVALPLALFACLLPFVPWSVPIGMLNWLMHSPFRALRTIFRMGRARPGTFAG